jgi:ribonuclease P protein component
VKKNKGFPKSARLKSASVIGRMFKEGQSFGQYPLRLVWIPLPENRKGDQVQFALSVPKKKFPHAVDRNRLRRQMREAYRLQKHKLYAALEGQKAAYGLMVIYVAAEQLGYAEIENNMNQGLRRLAKKWKERGAEPTEQT